MITRDKTPCSECGTPHPSRSMYYMDKRFVCSACIESATQRRTRETTIKWRSKQHDEESEDAFEQYLKGESDA